MQPRRSAGFHKGAYPLAKPGANHIAEWFGHRVYPTVTLSPEALGDQYAERCPFLTEALSAETRCVKSEASLGVCTISCTSKGQRQDWLVCPNRVVETSLLDEAVERLFGAVEVRSAVFAAPRLVDAKVRRMVLRQLRAGNRVVVYLRDKLGGEVSLGRTERSPELSFDITLVEIVAGDGRPDVGRYGFFEIQTMDFHGSYRHAVKNLKDALRLHGEQFFAALAQNSHWLGDRVEGPNIANVFKRTFYQVALKFRLSEAPHCAGTILGLPEAVWRSWSRHLGGPELLERPDGVLELRAPTESSPANAWIYVFDIDAAADATPNPIVATRRIATSADALAYYALQVAPQEAMREGGAASRLQEAIRRRILVWWPDLEGARA